MKCRTFEMRKIFGFIFYIQNPQTINTIINQVKYDSPTVRVGVEVNVFFFSWSAFYPIRIEKHKSNNARLLEQYNYYEYFRITAAALMCGKKRGRKYVILNIQPSFFIIMLFIQKIERIFCSFFVTLFSQIPLFQYYKFQKKKKNTLKLTIT